MRKIIFTVITIAGILLFVGCPTPNDPTSTTYAVTVNTSGSEPDESVTADVSEVAEGATVTLTASLNNGRRVALSASGATISPSTISTNGGTVTFTMPAATVEVTATFSDIAVTENGFTGTLAIGNVGTVTLSSESLKMIYANNSNSMTFPTGEDDSGDSTLAIRFWIAETEVTNAVVAEVLQWAYDNDRFSTTVGNPNGLDTTTAKHGGQQLLVLSGSYSCRVDYDGSGTFTAESGYESNPATNITWYGAVMFCNWLTEMRDGHTDNVVYTDIDTDWEDDETTENISRNGYRLPSNDEWEYAARYIDGTTWNGGDHVSGGPKYDVETGSDNVGDYAWYFGNNSGSSGDSTYGTKEVGQKTANALGMHDMSGNVWEWVFTESVSERFCRGGSWYDVAYLLPVGYLHSYSPDDEYNYLGFRPCRTAD